LPAPGDLTADYVMVALDGVVTLASAAVLIAAVILFVRRWAKKGFPAPGAREATGIPVEPEPPGTPYRVYTKAFDKEMRARDIPGALWALSPDSERGFLRRSAGSGGKLPANRIASAGGDGKLYGSDRSLAGDGAAA
jgi:hypothetical protein